MQLLDTAALFVLVLAVVAFGLGEIALARSDDLEALYCLLVGVVAIRSAVQLARPGSA